MSEQFQLAPASDLNEGFYDLVECQHGLRDAQADLASLLNATDALENLREHLRTHDVVSNEHRQALIVSLENLVGDSGLSPADIIPELDGHAYGTVSTEGLGDKLHDLWKRIVAAIMAILSTVRTYWKKVASFRGRLHMQAEHLAKLGAVSKLTTAKTPEVELGVEIKSLIQGDRPLYDPDAIVRGLAAGVEQYKNFTDLYSKEMVKIGRSFEQVLTGNLTGHEALLATCGVFEELPIGKIATKLRAMIYRDPRFGNRMTLAAPPMIGGWTIYFLMLEKEQEITKTENLAAYAQALRTTGVRFAYSNPNTFNVTSGKVRTAYGAQVQAIALKVIDLLDTIEAQERFIASTRIESQVKAILRAGERYQTRVGQANGYDQSVLRFVRSYASWAIGPSDQMTTNLLSVSRSALIYCRKSLNIH